MGEKIPKIMQSYYDSIEELLINFSNEFLNEEYKELCLHALAKLCRKRPSPLLKGRKNTWAAGIIHAVGSANFIFDKSQEIHLEASTIADYFNLSKSTVSQKASEIKKMLKIDYFSNEWILKSKMDDNPFVWYVSFEGEIYDVRELPLYFQIACYEKGLIPYIPYYGPDGK